MSAGKGDYEIPACFNGQDLFEEEKEDEIKGIYFGIFQKFDAIIERKMRVDLLPRPRQTQTPPSLWQGRQRVGCPE